MKTKLSTRQIELILMLQRGDTLLLIQPKTIGVNQFYVRTLTGNMIKTNYKTADVLRKFNIVKVSNKINEHTRYKYEFELTEMGKSGIDI